MKILITGAAGFIGCNLIQKIMENTDWEVVGYDNFFCNDLYLQKLKKYRLNSLGIYPEVISFDSQYQSITHNNFKFQFLTLTEQFELEERYDIIIHLAASTGVRDSIKHPNEYIRNNIEGFTNLLEAIKNNKPKYLIYASSSSVYGLQPDEPFNENICTYSPLNIYAFTKRANEYQAYVYNHLYDIKCIGLRFFTVYGPWGRPDMIYYKWIKAIMEGKEIQIYNDGKLFRDFTYIDDITNGMIKMISDIEEVDPSIIHSKYNMGRSEPVDLTTFISILKEIIGKEPNIKYLPMQPGEMYQTYSDSDRFKTDFARSFDTPLGSGLIEFVNWYNKYQQ